MQLQKPLNGETYLDIFTDSLELASILSVQMDKGSDKKEQPSLFKEVIIFGEIKSIL